MLKPSFPGQSPSLELAKWATWAAGMGEVQLLLFTRGLPGAARLHGNSELTQERMSLMDDNSVPSVGLSFPCVQWE